MEGQSAALCDDLDRKSFCGLQHQTIPCSEALRVRGRQRRFCLISGVGVFISILQSMVFTTPNCKLGLNMACFLEIIFNERDLST